MAETEQTVNPDVDPASRSDAGSAAPRARTHQEGDASRGARRIKVYIVTYRRPEVLEAAVESLYRGMHDPSRVDVTILNNHSEFTTPSAASGIRVVHNVVRPDHSWGYLARDWNWCLLDAFGDWRGGETDWCLLAQNDAMWADDWQHRLDALDDVDFFNQPIGDQSMGFRLEALQRVGFFDERFSTLHFHEQDYFNRAAILLRERASIDDGHDESAGTEESRPSRGLITTHKTSYGLDYESETLHTPHSLLELRNLAMRKWQTGVPEDLFNRPLMLGRFDAGMLSLPAEIDWYPYFWHGFRGSRPGLAAYETPFPQPARSLIIVEDEYESLVERLVAAAPLVSDGVEVLVDCRDDAAASRVRSEVGDALTFLPASIELTDRTGRLERLNTLARGRVKLVVGAR